MSALKALRRPPVTVAPASAGTGSTPARRACLTWVTVADGLSENIRAAVPVTCDAAMEVPCLKPYWSSWTPGGVAQLAVMSSSQTPSVVALVAPRVYWNWIWTSCAVAADRVRAKV